MFSTPRTAQITYLDASGGKIVVKGRKSGHALGIIPLGGRFASVLLLPGYIIEDGFVSIKQAHAFNLALTLEKGVDAGAMTIAEFLGQSDAVTAQEIVKVLKRKVQQKEDK